MGDLEVPLSAEKEKETQKTGAAKKPAGFWGSSRVRKTQTLWGSFKNVSQQSLQITLTQIKKAKCNTTIDNFGADVKV